MKKILFGIFIIIGIFLIDSFSGLHFKEINAVPGDVKLISSSDIGGYAKAVLFEDNTTRKFGVAEIEKKFGFLYRYDGGSWSGMVEKGKPFQANGIGDDDDFLVAIKTAKNSNIEYIALGNHMEGVKPSDKYKLTLDDVRENIDEYYLKEVEDNYVLFVTEEYSEDTWTIRAFDEEGNLIADELFGGEARYIDWE
ncbi:hypothetical protein GLW08_16485 [Pontibacillus yanchengensis]|uniref:Uncharacterized protein n=1 Tax=Pontibacillus yanchengensis TaxID=462910 RepID=A0ACC7VJG1_9BACI|nr:hypothetical protein [Pontibacillus yanchengensis]MYL54933.1 hypothetical protein [Pontibacillus yanchengensis]